jgi:hypothetical protein
MCVPWTGLPRTSRGAELASGRDGMGAFSDVSFSPQLGSYVSRVKFSALLFFFARELAWPGAL